jgi:predicted deacetylase
MRTMPPELALRIARLEGGGAPPLGSIAVPLGRARAGNPSAPARPRRTIAVALHDIEPATFERCALLREWLDDRGVDRVTLLVIPARDLHPLGERSPEMVGWLSARRRAGDSIAQHGFRHEQLRRGELSRQTLAHTHGRRAAAEFVGLDGEETRRAVNAGWRLLKLAGVEPDGFVAPAYAYTPALRRALAPKFRWWAGLLRLHGTPAPHGAPADLHEDIDEPSSPTWLAPTWSLASDNPLRRPLSPSLIRIGSMLSAHTLRLDLYPSDLQHRRQLRALEQALGRGGRQRQAITYDEITAASPHG